MKSSCTHSNMSNSSALLGFLRNDTRDGQGEKGIRKFQHFTGGSRPRGSLFLDLEIATAHTAAYSLPSAETF